MQQFVRGEDGLIPARSRIFTFQQIKDSRTAEVEAGRPSDLDDYYAAHQLCYTCLAEGVAFVRLRKPVTDEEIEAAQGLNVEELPIWAVCPQCGGTRRSGR